MSTTRLLAGSSGDDGLHGALENVAQLKSLHQVRVPDHAAVLDTDVGKVLVDVAHLLDTLVERSLRTEDGSISLHSLLHVETNLGSGLGTVSFAIMASVEFIEARGQASSPNLIEEIDSLQTGLSRDLLVGLSRGHGITDVVSDGTTEDDDIEEGVGTETVSTVHGNRSGFTSGVETRDDLVVAVLVDGDDLTSVAGRNTAHVVVNGGQDGDGLLGDIDTSEDGSGLRDTRQTLMENISGEMAELEVDVILLRTNTTTLADFDGHGTRDNVTGSKILGSRSITFHEAFTLGVQEVSSLTSRT